jgi:uncharacterized phage-associated protein/DNA-binding transcriptional regulator YiaG
MKKEKDMNQPIVYKQKETYTFRKEEFEIVAHYFVDEDRGYEYTTTEIDELNVQQLYNKYRAKHKLPFVDDIKAIRAKYAISASKMSEILGFGANVYRNYENGEIPSESNARLIQLIEDPSEFKKLLNLQKDNLKDEDYEKILKRIENQIPQYNNNFNKNARNIYNGFQRFDNERFANLVVFFSETMKPYKTKLNKLLFYTDFCHFKKTGFSVSGATYRAIQFGPVPNDYDTLYQEVIKKEKVECVVSEDGDFISEQYLPIKNKTFDASLFSEDEIKTLNKVSQKFKGINAKKIKDISHEETAWIENEKSKGLISFDYAFDLKYV